MGRCLVSVPFERAFDDFYRQTIVRATLAAGLDPVRAPDLDRPHGLDAIEEALAEAVACVVDGTGRTPGAMYVLAAALAFRTPLVLIAQNLDDLPFDMRWRNPIVYRPGAARWEDMIKMQLQSALRECVSRAEAGS